MNYVKHLSIALLVLCAVPAATAVKFEDKDLTEVTGHLVGNTFYPKDMILEGKNGNDKVTYIIGDDAKAITGDVKAVKYYKHKDGMWVDENKESNPDTFIFDKAAAKDVKVATARPKYLAVGLDGKANDSYAYALNCKWHKLSPGYKTGIKVAAAVAPFAIAAAAYHLSPAVQKKMKAAYAKAAQFVSDVQEGKENARRNAALAAVALAAASYGVYLKGGAVWDAVSPIDRNPCDAYTAAA